MCELHGPRPRGHTPAGARLHLAAIPDSFAGVVLLDRRLLPFAAAARTFARAGERVHVTRAADLAATATTATGLGRSEPGGASSSPTRRQPGDGAAGIAGAVVARVLPLVRPILGAVSRDTVVTSGGLAALGLLVAFRAILAWRERQPLASVMLHPVTVIAALGAMLLSLIDAVRGRPATWRGRPYEEPNP